MTAFRDDSLRVWEAMHQYAKDVLALYYPDDATVTKDDELAAMLLDLRRHGLHRRSDIPERSVFLIWFSLSSILFLNCILNNVFLSGSVQTHDIFMLLLLVLSFLHPSFHPSIHQSINESIHQSIRLFIDIFIHLIHSSNHLSRYTSSHLFMHLPICKFFQQSSIHTFLYLFILLSYHPSINPSLITTTGLTSHQCSTHPLLPQSIFLFVRPSSILALFSVLAIALLKVIHVLENIKRYIIC